MHIGVMTGATDGSEETLDGIVEFAKRVEAHGFHSVWMANIFSLDAIGTLAIVGRETSRISLGTAVTPTFPRHPTALAQQALTTQAACKGRFTLGIGLSHKLVIEDMLGLSYDRPARHMREYLQVLTPLLRGEQASFQGELYRVRARLQIPGGTPTPLLVAALGPQMLKLAGQLADGTVTWMTGPKTLEAHIGPAIREAAAKMDRPTPRIVSGLPIALTADVDQARSVVDRQLAIYGQLPSYRAMLDREGARGPADVALLGDESSLRAGIRRLREVGVTEFIAAPAQIEPGAAERTLEFLATEL